MLRRNGKVGARTLDRIGVAVTLRPGHGKGTGGNKFVERGTAAICRDVRSLGLGDLQKIRAHSGQADGLRGSRALIGRRQLFQIKLVHTEEDYRGDKNNGEGAHEPIVALGNAVSKVFQGD